MKKKTLGFDAVIGLFLICVFAAAMLIALASGAKIYESISDVMEEQYTSRTALDYVAAKVHACDADGGVEIGRIGGEEALLLHETYGAIRCTTYIYCYDGYICELFAIDGEDFEPTAGLHVLNAQALHFSLADRLLRIECRTAGGEGVQYVAIQSEGGTA